MTSAVNDGVSSNPPSHPEARDPANAREILTSSGETGPPAPFCHRAPDPDPAPNQKGDAVRGLDW